MAKLTKPFVQEIPLELIHETGNVRKTYNGIEELAKSIRDCGLLQPITIKATGTDENGNENYEIICGHRRYHAFLYLQSQNEPFNTIKAIVVTGDKAKLQLVENVQRENLSPIELEMGLKALIENGMTQTEIAEYLSKSLSWVCDALAGARVREQAIQQGIETEGISSKALSQLRTVPAEKLPEVIQEVKDNGGTVKAATQIIKKARATKPVVNEERLDSDVSFEVEENAEKWTLEQLDDLSVKFNDWFSICLDYNATKRMAETMIEHKQQIIEWLNNN